MTLFSFSKPMKTPEDYGLDMYLNNSIANTIATCHLYDSDIERFFLMEIEYGCMDACESDNVRIKDLFGYDYPARTYPNGKFWTLSDLHDEPDMHDVILDVIAKAPIKRTAERDIQDIQDIPDIPDIDFASTVDAIKREAANCSSVDDVWGVFSKAFDVDEEDYAVAIV